MADVVLQGWTVPSQPNTGRTVLDTNPIPEQYGFMGAVGDTSDVLTGTAEQMAVLAASGDVSTVLTDVAEQTPLDPVATSMSFSPARVKLIGMQANGSTDLRAIFQSPVVGSPAETHGTEGKWKFTTPTVVNAGSSGTVIQAITRFLRRISKLNRGSN
jgi:hypothetical protein